MGVGLFSAVGGLLFGLDIGYIAGVEAMPSFREDVNGGRPLGDWTAGTVTGAFAVGAVAASNPLASGASQKPRFPKDRIFGRASFRRLMRDNPESS